MAIISAKNINKIYNTNKISFQALHSINLDVNEGDFLTLVGPSGSGKSTLLNLLGGLDKPTSGSIYLGGEELSNLKRGQLAKIRRQQIGFIFQSFNLVPVLTAYENIELPLILQKVSHKDRRKRINEALDIVELSRVAKNKPTEMSGGQQQRVAIARALVANPKIILADEPTANLDSKNSYSILELMKNINKTTGTTFIFSTHDPKIMEYATRTVQMKDGHILSDELIQVN